MPPKFLIDINISIFSVKNQAFLFKKMPPKVWAYQKDILSLHTNKNWTINQLELGNKQQEHIYLNFGYEDGVLL